MGVVGSVGERGRDAVGAYALLHEADRHPTGALRGADLAALAEAAWWAGRIEESVGARLRAHAAYVAEGDPRGAGLSAWWLAFTYRRLGRPVAAAGWTHRARHHLEGLPDCPEQCFLALTDVAEAEEHHAPAAALAAARRMTRLAVRSGSPDLLALSRQTESSVLIAQGRRAEGLALLDDAMRAVTAGELSPLFTGWLYSLALTRVAAAGDPARAARWADAATAWCAAPSQARNPFRAVCRIRHAEVLDLLGAWERAEDQARGVLHDISADSLDAAAAAAYTVGELQRRRGHLAEAARAYAHAHDLGRVPQPGLALLRLAQGRADAARAGLRLALDCQSDPRHDLAGRARLLVALTEVTLALGQTGAAAEAVSELERLATPDDLPLLTALASGARGALALTRGEPAHNPLRRALALWRELRAPYETARVRVLLARAAQAAGDTDTARRERAAARAALTRLGAPPEP
ncbi:LuxR family transcriptional regulator [Streptomyces sp. NPDC006339]|uniref:LuxR family transcriptional regulator n=1 Tax=Streptomyces sp. NPDC006339 TaxID=3156755 RepID=UPI0033AA60E0